MNEMREARIVMPWLDGHEGVHTTLQAALCKAFGGFTVSYGSGGWVDDAGEVIRDRVRIYDVAMERSAPNDSRLRDIAIEAGNALGQQSVYLRYSSGSTAIISLTALAKDRDPGLDTYEQLGDLSSMRGIGLQVTAESKAVLEAAKYGTPIGSKRLPQVGDIWLARDGATRIAVLKQATLLDGGFECVTLTKGATALKEGYPIVVDLDGRYIRGVPQETHPLDLMQCQFNFII